MKNKQWRFYKGIFTLLPVYSFLLLRVGRQKRFIANHLEKDLFNFKVTNDGSLEKKEFKKITHYYALGVPGVLGEALAVLRGESMTARERLCLSYLGGISGLLDDLFDDPGKEVSHLKGFILHPEEMKPGNSHEELLLNLYQKGLTFSNHPEKLKQQAVKVFEAQVQSTSQKIEVIPPPEIEAITKAKGGESFLFYRLCMEHRLEKAEADLLYHLGGLMQLGNDIFDVWEDHKEGTVTEATMCADIDNLRDSFDLKLKETFSLAENTTYDKKNINKFLKITTLALARVYVCLDQFKKLQKTSGNIFTPEKYSRKQLICDMQRPRNQFSTLKYYLKII
ncbi:MAG TPA: class 1 isoprenoid biosynthesis enzyme [Gillisia sp.]|nr:class 1 isoprenoid biosynthesis enzyme [Gillisia sp.]